MSDEQKTTRPTSAFTKTPIFNGFYNELRESLNKDSLFQENSNTGFEAEALFRFLLARTFRALSPEQIREMLAGVLFAPANGSAARQLEAKSTMGGKASPQLSELVKAMKV